MNVRRLAVALFLFFVAAPLAAADMQAVSFLLDKTSGLTGERATATLRVRNNGPDTATNVTATVNTLHAQALYLSAAAPAGWTCTLGFGVGACSTASMAAGAEAEIRFELLLPPVPVAQERVIGGIFTSPPDTQMQNNSIARNIAVNAAPDRADLVVSVGTASTVIPERTEGLLELGVQNRGPAAARNVRLAIRASQQTQEPLAIQPDGEGWTCTATGPGSWICLLPSLPAERASSVNVRFTAPNRETYLYFQAGAVAELNHDPSPTGSFTSISVGSAENWHRMLIPLTAQYGPSPWRVDVTMLIRSDTQIPIAPHPCEFIAITCFIGAPPLQRQFDAYLNTILPPEPSEPGALFLYVRQQDREKVRINARVYNLQHFGRTAGSEIPIARDEEFTTGTIRLLGIPTGAGYRQMLRVYDTRETENTSVEVRIYANDETEARVTEVHALGTSEFMQRTTTAQLATHPGYMQLDLRRFDQALAGARTLRVEVQPLTPGSRIWSFVSITNNDTQHVTVVSPL